jgi:hypothetical protein
MFNKIFWLLLFSFIFTFTSQTIAIESISFNQFIALVEINNLELKIKKTDLDSTKKELEKIEAKYEIKTNLKIGAEVNKDSYYSSRPKERRLNLDLDILNKNLKSGGQLVLDYNYDNYLIDYLGDSSSNTNDEKNRLRLKYTQPLLKGFLGLSDYDYEMNRAKLRYKKELLLYKSYKNNLLYNASLTYLSYSTTILIIKNLYEEIKLLNTVIYESKIKSKNIQDNLNLLDFKIKVSARKQQINSEKQKLVELKYKLLTFLSNENPELAFTIFDSNKELDDSIYQELKNTQKRTAHHSKHNNYP